MRRSGAESARAERNTGLRAGSTTDEQLRLKEPEREDREPERPNEILRRASVY